LKLVLTVTSTSAQGAPSSASCVTKHKESRQTLDCTAGVQSVNQTQKKLVSSFRQPDRAIPRSSSTAKRDSAIAQNTASPEKENSPEEKWKKQMQKEAEEDKRFAATCDPIKRKVMTILRSAGLETRAFNQAVVKLKEIQAQLVGSCPERIQIFGGFVEKVVPCYNNNWLLRLSDGRDFSFPP